jgi:glycerophosphoryl diester phosphodiesterase
LAAPASRRKRRALIAAALMGALASYIVLNNTSLSVARSPGEPVLLAHRGVAQRFDIKDLRADTCTAARMLPPRHDFLENTLPSIKAAFALGADVVEIDVQPTTDGKFAVFHDWTLDCRTEGTGETRSHDMAYLKTLDVGYGYTPDGGKTFPLRGTGVGMMPELSDVLAAMPDKRFIVNFKSNEAREGGMLADFAAAHPEWASAIWGAYGGDAPTLAARARLPNLNIWTRKGLTNCLLQYEGYGWTGILPPACRDTILMVPINFAPWLWGWPNRFMERMRTAGTQVILIGPYAPGDAGTSGIDTAEQAAEVPAAFDGYVWTNEIATIAPHFRRPD